MLICPPALIYLIFCIVQIILDSINGLYNTALVKTFVAIIITFLLDVLCKMGLGIISWIIVLIPFIFMAVITSLLLYIFGLDVATGQRVTTIYNKETENSQPQPQPQPIVIKSNMTSPPFPPWMLPNTKYDTQPHYLTVSTPEANTNIVKPRPDAIIILPMPVQNLG